MKGLKFMNTITIYIIGSLSNSDVIEDVAELFANMADADITYVKPQPDKSHEELIHQCYEKIKVSDIVVAVVKKDGTLGDGTLYEIEYARSLGKKIYKIQDIS